MSQSQGFFLEKLCQISEDLVSAVMTIGIVDLFEEINVSDGNTEIFGWICCNMIFQDFLHTSAVIQCGKRICGCLLLQLHVVEKEMFLCFLKIRTEGNAD